MRIYIAVDMEGISGIYCREQVIAGERLYEKGCALMARDVNACARALKDMRVDEVWVLDAHSSGRNLDLTALSEDVDMLIQGDVGNCRFPGIDGADGIILLGYHAMAGTARAVLDHTWDSTKIQDLRLNGQSMGEILLDAVIAGEHGVPCILVTGDDKACAEAERQVPGVHTAVVKHGLSSFGGMLLSLDKAHAVIAERTMQAVAAIKEAKPLTLPAPLEFSVELTERSRLPKTMGNLPIEITGGRTFRCTADSMEKAIALVF